MENNHPVGLLFLSSEIRDHARASQKACDGLTIDQLKAGVVEKMARSIKLRTLLNQESSKPSESMNYENLEVWSRELFALEQEIQKLLEETK